MNAAYFHLVVNHLPLFAALFGAALLGVGLLRRSDSLTTAGLALAVLAGVGAVAAVQSGERAEDIVEAIVGVSEEPIEEHEESAEIAQWAAIASGLSALLALLVPARMAVGKRGTSWSALALTLVALALIARAANDGGKIRHFEIDDSASSESVQTEDDEEHR